jgi:hypothetical protein
MISTTSATTDDSWINYPFCEGSATCEPINPFSISLKFGQCVVCKGDTQTQLGGYYCHPECAKWTAQIVQLAEIEIPQISLQILCSKRCLEASILAAANGDYDKVRTIKKDVEKKAWKIFKEKHPKPKSTFLTQGAKHDE